MYKIIGADQKEYGPVSAEQIRDWIAQGRANGQTLAQAEGATSWNPLSSFPDFAQVLAAQAGQGSAPVPPTAAPLKATGNVLEQDYQLDVTRCIGRGWELVKEDLASIIPVTLAIVVVTVAINQFIGYFTNAAVQSLIRGNVTPQAIMVVVVGYVASLPIYSVIYAGLFFFLLKKIRGEEAGVGDAFSGFGSAFGQLAVLGVVKGLLVLVGLAMCVIPGIYLSVVWVFCEPLVIDKKLDFWAAMELSRKLVSKHWLTVFCLLLLSGIVMFGGLLACCVGVLVTIPIGYAAMMFAYEDIFRG